MRSRLKAIICEMLVAVSFLGSTCGCGAPARDVSYDSRYAAGYDIGASYRLVRDVAIVRGAADHWDTGTKYYLTDPGYLAGIEEYRPGDKGIGRVVRGSQIQIVRIVAKRVSPVPMYTEDLIRPVAIIRDGSFANVVVDVAEISSHIPNQRLHADQTAPSSKFVEPMADSRPSNSNTNLKTTQPN